ncbi:response regulator transcription factor [Galbibacter sp. BG1]|uniref:response regulator transcription factor n=1 Tax=Galbibacter sp. BG1 TaxID=1170699 RepID=UPI0015BF29F5|nr:response regulator transcription factor [Galbibacter sp. BG1]QLE01306.1 response regulator transcription factor [Galbibacter sp. BG1]
MFKKVLIAEDIDSINAGLIANLKQSFDFEIDHAKYCDDALLKFKKAVLDRNPYDLLITDLSFKQDHRECAMYSGDALAKAVLTEDPSIKVIVYSIEDRPQKIKSLFQEAGISAYICKGRESAKEFKTAIETIYTSQQYLSPEIAYAMNGEPVLEIEEFDILLLKELANGNSQDEISALFKEKNIKPSSLSSIEKRLNKLKISFKAKNATHLVSIVKDLGLI